MATAEALDHDINDLRDRIATLEAHRANLTSILLSQPHLPARLEQRSGIHERDRRNAPKRSATKAVQKQSARNLENIYRACAGVTAYKVKDPDPCAVDNGNVLGVRIEVSIGGIFVDTYHVLLNRPNAAHKSMLKIHKHTIPPCIPLQPLAHKWLPMTRKDAEEPTEQDLIKFGRHLRKELVGWHLRSEALERLRKSAGLPDRSVQEERAALEPAIGTVLNAFVSDDEESDEEEEDEPNERDGPPKVTNIDADAAVREISIAWSNGRTGVFKVTKDGEVDKAAVRTKDGTREASLNRNAIGRVEELLQRLSS